MPKNTKKSERAALLKERRKVRRKNAAKKAAKRSVKRVARTHPHRRTAALVFVSMRFHPDQVFIAARAVCKHGNEICLGTGRAPECSLETKIVCYALLQRDDGRVFAVHVIADFSLKHGLAHARAGLGHGVTAQVDDVASIIHLHIMPPWFRTLTG